MQAAAARSSRDESRGAKGRSSARNDRLRVGVGLISPYRIPRERLCEVVAARLRPPPNCNAN